MKITLLDEHGYEWAALGFSLSYETLIDRAKAILARFAFGKSGENKFMECIQLWIDIDAPRYWWQEFDTYRVGITKQSASTMHTITKRNLEQSDFEYPIDEDYLEHINFLIEGYRAISKMEDTNPLKKLVDKKISFLKVKNALPEGFLQRRIVTMNYKVLRHMYEQRIDHRLPEWPLFLNHMLEHIEHPEFIVKNENS